MTAATVRAEIERQPFIPLRLHLVSGRTVDVLSERSAFMLRHALLVLQDFSRGGRDAGYNVVSVRNIEMIEQLALGNSKRRRGG